MFPGSRGPPAPAGIPVRDSWSGGRILEIPRILENPAEPRERVGMCRSRSQSRSRCREPREAAARSLCDIRVPNKADGDHDRCVCVIGDTAIPRIFGSHIPCPEPAPASLLQEIFPQNCRDVPIPCPAVLWPPSPTRLLPSIILVGSTFPTSGTHREHPEHPKNPVPADLSFPAD